MAEVRQRKPAAAAAASAAAPDAGIVGSSREDSRGRDKPQPPPAPLSRCAYLCCRFGGRSSKPVCGCDCEGESPSCLEWSVWLLGISAVAVSVAALAFILHLRGGYSWPKSAVVLANALWNAALTLTGNTGRRRSSADAVANAAAAAEVRAQTNLPPGVVVQTGLTQALVIAALVFALLALVLLPMMYVRRRCERKVPAPDADPTGPLGGGRGVDLAAAAADLSDDVEADALLRGFKARNK